MENRQKPVKKIRILWLHSHLLYWMGGSIYIYEVLKALTSKKGHQATLITSIASDFSKKEFAKIGVEVKELSGFSTNSPVYWLFMPLFLRIELGRLEKEISKNDVIISSMFPMNVLAAETGKPFIQLCYEPYTLFHDKDFVKGFPFHKRIFINLVGRIYSGLDIKATRKAAQVITLSEQRKKWIADIYKRDDAVVVYYGVDTQFFRKIKDKTLIDKYKNKDVILHSTDFTATKGTNYLIKALPGVIKQFPDTLLLITYTLKNPNIKQEMLNLAEKLGIKSKIKFLGFVNKERLPAYYSLARIVIQPSIGQSMNLFALEAMACETPVILNLEGQEQTKNGEAGFLIDPKKTKDLENAIVQIFSRPRLAQKMGQKGREIILSKFSWKKVGKSFSRNIRQIIG